MTTPQSKHRKSLAQLFAESPFKGITMEMKEEMDALTAEVAELQAVNAELAILASEVNELITMLVTKITELDVINTELCKASQ